MRIGEDFEKMEFSWFGLDLLEPNALLTDSLIAVFCIIFWAIISRQNKTFTTPFFNYWKWLFLVYGVGFFFGGLGHVMFNYWDVTGKYFPLIGGLAIPLFIEHAMISLLPEKNHKALYLTSKIKFALAVIALTLVFLLVPGEKKIPMMLLVPSANSGIGFILASGVLGLKFAKQYTRSFYLLAASVLVMIPAAVFQAKRISFHPWFDRNDASHVLLIVTLILYYYTVQGYRKYLLSTSQS